MNKDYNKVKSKTVQTESHPHQWMKKMKNKAMTLLLQCSLLSTDNVCVLILKVCLHNHYIIKLYYNFNVNLSFVCALSGRQL